MKSNLFSKYSYDESEDFVKDLKRLIEIEHDILLQLPTIVYESVLANTPADKEKLVKDHAERLHIDEAVINSNASIVHHFLKELSPDGDGGKDDLISIKDDAVDLNLLDKKKSDIFIAFLEKIKGIAIEQFYHYKRLREYESSGLPTIVGLTSTVNLRAIFDEEFKTTTGLKNYKPKCEGLTPVAIIKLRFDSDSPLENVFFQAGKSELRIIIEYLESIEKQIEETITYSGLQRKD